MQIKICKFMSMSENSLEININKFLEETRKEQQNLVQIVQTKLPYMFMVLIEMIQKLKKNLIDYKHH